MGAEIDPKPIPGFAPHGSRYRAYVSLEREDAVAVAEEAERRGITVSRVLEDRVKVKRRKAGD